MDDDFLTLMRFITKNALAFPAYVGKLSSVFRRLVAFRADERIRLVGETISGVQVIKMYAWEKPFIALVQLARK